MSKTFFTGMPVYVTITKNNTTFISDGYYVEQGSNVTVSVSGSAGWGAEKSSSTWYNCVEVKVNFNFYDINKTIAATITNISVTNGKSSRASFTGSGTYTFPKGYYGNFNIGINLKYKNYVQYYAGGTTSSETGYVYSYEPPSITSFDVWRTASYGATAKSATGTYAAYKATVSYTSSSWNSIVYNLMYRSENSSQWMTISNATIGSNKALTGYTFSKETAYYFKFAVTDRIGSQDYIIILPKAYALFSANSTKDAVGIGRFVSSSESGFKVSLPSTFESNTVFSGTVNLSGGVSDMNVNWVQPTLNSGVTSPNANNYGGGVLKYGYIGKHVFIKGSASVKAGVVMFTMPSSLRPTTGIIYRIVPCEGTRVARLILKTNGEFSVEWFRSLDTGSSSSSEHWVQCDLDYWID